MKKLFAIFPLIFTLYISNAQSSSDICSVKDDIGKNISLSLHLLADSLGEVNINISDIQVSVDALNTHFGKIGISFTICKVDTIPHHKYNDLQMGKNEQEIESIFYDKNYINLYYVDDITNKGGAVEKPAGYAPLGGLSVPSDVIGRDAIYIKKGVNMDGVHLHEVGHYFGLVHTFSTSNGVELADGSNCATAGDKICDTAADPYPKGNLDAQKCILVPAEKDFQGNYYNPPVCNIMSYYNPTCEQGFTCGQYNYMIDVIMSGRNYLW
jgi:hypothetical protein